ncbi:unnamed protein product, partial [Didymodactylos carnosus]
MVNTLRRAIFLHRLYNWTIIPQNFATSYRGDGVVPFEELVDIDAFNSLIENFTGFKSLVPCMSPNSIIPSHIKPIRFQSVEDVIQQNGALYYELPIAAFDVVDQIGRDMKWASQQLDNTILFGILHAAPHIELAGRRM